MQAGLLADLLMRNCNAISVERTSFRGGSRYAVRFVLDAEVHIVSKGDRLFVEFWLPRYAMPVMVMDYSGLSDTYGICREICSMLYSISWEDSRIIVREISP